MRDSTNILLVLAGGAAIGITIIVFIILAVLRASRPVIPPGGGGVIVREQSSMTLWLLIPLILVGIYFYNQPPHFNEAIGYNRTEITSHKLDSEVKTEQTEPYLPKPSEKLVNVAPEHLSKLHDASNRTTTRRAIIVLDHESLQTCLNLQTSWSKRDIRIFCRGNNEYFVADFGSEYETELSGELRDLKRQKSDLAEWHIYPENLQITEF